MHPGVVLLPLNCPVPRLTPNHRPKGECIALLSVAARRIEGINHAFAHACSRERAHRGKIERGEVNVTLATTLKLIRGLDLSLTAFFSELEKELNGIDESR